MASLFAPILHDVGSRRGDRALRRNFSKKVALFLKLKLDAARAFINHGKIDVAFALERQEFLLLAFFKVVIRKGNLDAWSYLPTDFDIDLILA